MRFQSVCYTFLVAASLLVAEEAAGTDARALPRSLGGELASDEQSGFSCRAPLRPDSSTTADWLRCVLHKSDWDSVLSTYLSAAICRRLHGAEATSDALDTCRQQMAGQTIGRQQLLALVMENQQVIVASRRARQRAAVSSQNAGPSEEMQSDQPSDQRLYKRSENDPQASESSSRINTPKGSKKEAPGEQLHSPQQSASQQNGVRRKRTGVKDKQNDDEKNLVGLFAPPSNKNRNSHSHRNTRRNRGRTARPLTTSSTPTTEMLMARGEGEHPGGGRPRGRRVSTTPPTPPPQVQAAFDEEGSDYVFPQTLPNVIHVRTCNAQERAQCLNGATGCQIEDGQINCTCHTDYEGDRCQNARNYYIENPPNCSVTCSSSGGKCIRMLPGGSDFCRCLTGFEGARCEQVTLDSVFGFGYAIHSSSDFESTSSESQLAALSATFSSVESGDAELIVGDRTRAEGTSDADADAVGSTHRRGRRSAAATRVDIVVPMEYPSGAEASGSGTRVAAAADRREGDTDANHNTASGSGTDKSSSRSVSK